MEQIEEIGIVIKKKTPILKKFVDRTLKTKPQNLKNPKKSFLLDEIIEMLYEEPVKKFSITPNRVVLNTIIEELEPKIDYHLQITHFIHFCSYSDKSFKMSWPFGENSLLTFIRSFDIKIKDQWYVNKTIIKDVQQFIDDNTKNLQIYLENHKLTQETIKQLQPILGDYYVTFTEIGWGFIKDTTVLLKVVIDKFNINNTQVTFGDDVTIHNNNITLMEFINENLDKITTFKKQVYEYNLNKQILLEEKIKINNSALKIQKWWKNLQLDKKIKQHNNTIKQKKSGTLFINRPKKEFIEQITCKPYNTDIIYC